MPNKLSGTAIQSGTITSTQLSATLTTTIESGGGPKIASIIYPGNDLAANTVGGQTLYITGSGFKSNSTVYINGNNVPSVSYISASNLSFTGPALSSASYPVYVINPEDGATAILIPGLQVSGEPSWVTGATLTEQDATDVWNISLSATGDAPLTYALAAGSSLPTGITLASNGVISGTITTPPESDTTYNFTVVASDAQNQDSSRAFSVTAKVGEGVLFANNVLLIHADGTNNQNNHTFLDSSTNNFTITRNGNPTQGSYSPHSQTGWSNYFDGTGDYLTTPSISLSGDFTIEAWMYIPSLSAARGLCTVGDANISSGVEFYVNTSNRIGLFGGNAQILVGTSVTFNINRWNHVAFVRSGGTIKAYLNGVADSTTASNSTTFSGAVRIGVEWYNNALGGTMMLGYISNFRILAGTAAYTTNFTPSTTPLQPVTNTSILTCQSYGFIDEGPNNYALTRNGDVSVQPFEPFAPVITTANSNSVYFDGSSDSITYTGGSSLNFGTSDFTIETWVYMSNTNTFSAFLRPDDEGAFPEFGYDWSASELKFQARNAAITNISTTAVAPNAWNHIAISRSGTSLRAFVNGTQVGTTVTNSTNFGSTTGTIRIGGSSFSGSHSVNGNLSNFRVVKGTAVYTANFTVPTTPLTAISNTSLLICQSTTLTDNSTNAYTLTANGNVRPRSFNPFGYVNTTSAYSTANVGGSAYFDGSGDYLSLSWGAPFNFGTGNFTIETWLYPVASLSDSLFVYDTYFYNSGSNTENGTTIFVNGNGSITFLTFPGTGIGNGQSVASASGIIKAGQWQHIAIVRNGNTVTIYVDGVQVAQNTNITLSISYDNSIEINGRNAESVSKNIYLAGYRVVKGTAVYTSGFTPPTAPPTNIANTSLLLNFTNAGIFDQTAKNVIETVGDAKVSTTQFKYGSASMYFDGTGDSLLIPASKNFDFGTGDFTVEFWMRSTDAAGNIIGLTTNAAGNWNLVLATSQLYWQSQYAQTNLYNRSATSILDGNWHHIAITRASGTSRMFFDGILQGDAVSDSTNYTAPNNMQIGNSGVYGEFLGYLDDLRVTKGYARYTANFTPPTSAMKDK